MKDLVSLCSRRGFIFQSSGIYGGINGCWDFGPLGVELKRNLKDHWWYTFVQQRSDIVGLDASIVLKILLWQVRLRFTMQFLMQGILMSKTIKTQSGESITVDN